MSNTGVAAVEKALSLLDCFQPGKESLSLAVLAKATGIPVTTVYRLMNSLERKSYVVRSGEGVYSLGHRLHYLGKLYEQSFRLSAVVEPILRELATATGASASYSVVERGRWLCLFRVDPAEGLRITRVPGDLRDFDNTPTSDVLRYWGLKEPVFDRFPTLPIFKSGARNVHTAASAMPIFGAGDQFLAALTLSGAASSLEAARTDGSSVARHVGAAMDLSRRLGASAKLCERIYIQATNDSST
ncbi:IclR family transcriptional regulator (plasmid) [Paraburkholderia sp. PGU19]|uniref:IclR family transcriptional regulator n=1 Tax=Paraburkholderia sp. PGU19 TaxID=2735434 RepID=UPI0015DA24AB|nr:helix-turn-helix domain-containing protein [Paraburkholderia sp. PGU19]BCG04241.1 IclR family transcriptional regulator [Paraburkholderia sp. PGU19]